MPKTSRVFAEQPERAPAPGERAVAPPGGLDRAWALHRGKPELLQDAARAVLRNSFDHLQRLACRVPLYRLTLSGPLPDLVTLEAIDPVPGRMAVAQALAAGVWSFKGHTLRAGETPPWCLAAPSESWAEELHGFSWLRHWRAAAADGAETQARALIADWIRRFGRWEPVAWRPHVIGRRLMAWLSNISLLFEGADMIWRCALLRSLAEQARHLHRVAFAAPDGVPRITAATGLALSGICLSEGQRRLARGLALLFRQLSAQILPDGGHVSRSPQALADALADLLTLRLALVEARLAVPQALSSAIDRMASMLSALRHGDGRLALFHGSEEGSARVYEALLSRAREAARARVPAPEAHHSGYHRLAAGRTTIILDAGSAPRGRFAANTHASTLAFEMSVGEHRLIVNCGGATGRGSAWRAAARATAAHSTLTLADRSSMRFLSAEPFARWIGERPLEAPAVVASERADGAGGTWLVARHNGFRGLIHERRLYLSSDGGDVRGEDRLLAASPDGRGAPRLPFALRFHLHPDVRASLALDGSTILLLLPGGEGWRFRASRGHLALEESIYLGGKTGARKCEQIVIRSETRPGAAPAAIVKWAIHALPAKAARQ